MAESEYEYLEWESEGEAAEGGRLKQPSSSSSFKRRPPTGTPAGVTQVQLEAALARVDGKIKTVAGNISTISTRVNAIAASAKKEAEDRKKGLDGQNKDLNQKLQMLALLPLLVQQPKVTLAAPLATAGGGTITSISVPDSNTMDAILPLLMVGGLGGSSTSGGGMGFGDSGDGSMMLLALALAFSNK